ncbi:hypothetical protein D3C78_1501170 [compost metagenome]
MDALLAAGFELLDDPTRQVRDVADLGDADKTHGYGTDLLLRHPVGEQAAEVGDGQHAVGEHIRLTRLAGEIDVDVDLVVVPGRAGVQGQRGPVDRAQFQQRQLVADLYVAVLRNGHGGLLSAAPARIGSRRRARRAGW